MNCRTIFLCGLNRCKIYIRIIRNFFNNLLCNDIPIQTPIRRKQNNSVITNNLAKKPTPVFEIDDMFIIISSDDENV